MNPYLYPYTPTTPPTQIERDRAEHDLKQAEADLATALVAGNLCTKCGAPTAPDNVKVALATAKTRADEAAAAHYAFTHQNKLSSYFPAAWSKP